MSGWRKGKCRSPKAGRSGPPRTEKPGKPSKINSLRPIGPAAGVEQVVASAMLEQAKTKLRPRESNAHACIEGTRPWVPALTMKQQSSRTHEWGDTLWVAKVDFKDAFGTMRIDKAWQCTCRRLGADHAAAIMSLLMGNRTRPGWRGWRGEYTEMTVGGRQGSIEMPRLWAATPGDALAPTLQKWQEQGRGVLLPPSREFEWQERRCATNRADTAKRFTQTLCGRPHHRRSHLGRDTNNGAGRGKHGGQIRSLHLTEKLEMWCNKTTKRGKRVRLMSCDLKAQEEMDVLGAVLSRRPGHARMHTQRMEGPLGHEGKCIHARASDKGFACGDGHMRSSW